MSLSFRWSNFRSFIDTGWVDLKPLTIIIGANNSGKSSLLAPILLMKQTLESGDPNVPLLTRGPLINVGSFVDLIRNHDKSLTLNIEFRYHHHANASKNERRLRLGKFPPGAVSIGFASTERLVPNDFRLERYELLDTIGRKLLSRKRTKRGAFSLDFYPKLKFDESTKSLIRKDLPEHFLFNDEVVHVLLRQLIEGRPKQKKPQVPKALTLKSGEGMYFAAVSLVKNSLEDIFSNVSYIGPLRRPIRRFYEYSGDKPINVGVRGEFAPELIARAEKSTLGQLQKWIATLEFGGELITRNVRPDSFQIQVNDGKRKSVFNLTDLGSGFSQMLPILVEGLFSQKGSIIVAEQPELHLNPRLQLKFADLLTDIATQGKTMVVETHSEYILLRVRKLIAEGKISAHNVAILFVEKEHGVSVVKEVALQPNGSIRKQDWPKGFFEDSVTEAFRLAYAQSKGKNA